MIDPMRGDIVEEGLPEQLDRAAVPLPAFHGRLWSLRAREARLPCNLTQVNEPKPQDAQ